MNQHLGATYTLSVLIVAAFALLMARSEPRPSKSHPAVAKTPARDESNANRITRVETESGGEPIRRDDPARRVVPAQTLVRQVTHVRPAVSPRSTRGFTTVATGESLADVARRVYGSSEDVHKLWRANRDQLPEEATAPREGMVLRTP